MMVARNDHLQNHAFGERQAVPREPRPMPNCSEQEASTLETD